MYSQNKETAELFMPNFAEIQLFVADYLNILLPAEIKDIFKKMFKK